ncbi:MAG: PP2C family protein-serine/threonine phosphatase [Candidatus Sulfotelmatobacter sp.]
MKSIEPLPDAESRPELEMPPCGRICEDRICEDHIREARLIQSSLIPTATLRDQSIEIAFRFTPFFQVGGDFVDFFRLPDGLIGLYIGDVVGKGLPATMYGALVMGILRGIHKSGTETGAVLSLLNQRLLQRPLPGRFCSTLYAVFDPSTRMLAISNAGLPFPLHASAAKCQPLGQGGLPSGLLASATYDQHTVQLSPGDTVLFATDGLHESLNPEGIEFSSTCMPELWAQCQHKSATESLDHLFDGLQNFSNGIPPHDDITAVVLKVLP